MSEPYLEVTYRHGKAMAAYLYLPRQAEDKSYRTSKVDPGLIIDFNEQGNAIGIEITAPAVLTLATLNQVLADLGLPLVGSEDLAPLRAA